MMKHFANKAHRVMVNTDSRYRFLLSLTIMIDFFHDFKVHVQKLETNQSNCSILCSDIDHYESLLSFKSFGYKNFCF